MAEIGVTVLEKAGAGGHRIDDLLLRKHRADRLIAAAQTLRDRHEVGGDTLLLARVQRPVRPIPHITSSRIRSTP